ncbi:MAG: hypothetical protein ACFB15_16670 [Cyclobacteriaceae bacterium]
MTSSLRYWLTNTPEEVLTVPISDRTAWQELLGMTISSDEKPHFTIWLTQIEQIHQFVRQVPDLAWELMDYATEPLSLIYADAKPLGRNEAPTTEIAVRLLIQPELLKLLTTRQPWFSVRVEDISSKFSIENWITKRIELKTKGKQPPRLKTMRIFDNGRFSFLP